MIEENDSYSTNINEPSSLIYLDVNTLPTDLGLFLQELRKYLYCVQCNFMLKFTSPPKKTNLLNIYCLTSCLIFVCWYVDFMIQSFYTNSDVVCRDFLAVGNPHAERTCQTTETVVICQIKMAK